MYDEYYQFTGKPFQLNPDPSFFFQSKGHQRAMAYLRYGIQQEQGFIIVTGDVGTGKTMLVNNLVRELESKSIEAAKIVSSNVRENDLLRLIASNFNLPYERSSKAALLRHLEGYFRASKESGKRVLLLVDEVQNLPRESLEELRMLSNFDHNGEPLVQSFLLGQREFRTMMRAPGLEQLRQRVLAAYHLKPLSDKEVQTYIQHRLKKVGWNGNPNIDEDVYFSVFRFTNGVPRRINTLFDRVLLNSCLNESNTIVVEDVEMVADEMAQERSDDGADIPDANASAPEPEAAPDAVRRPDPGVEAMQASLVEIRKLTARIDAMQRTVDTLSQRIDTPSQQAGNPPTSLWSQTSGSKRATILSVLLGLGVAALGMAGAVVYRLLT